MDYAIITQVCHISCHFSVYQVYYRRVRRVPVGSDPLQSLHQLYINFTQSSHGHSTLLMISQAVLTAKHMQIISELCPCPNYQPISELQPHSLISLISDSNFPLLSLQYYSCCQQLRQWDSLLLFWYHFHSLQLAFILVMCITVESAFPLRTSCVLILMYTQLSIYLSSAVIAVLDWISLLTVRRQSTNQLSTGAFIFFALN